MAKNKKVDDYIKNAREDARPILKTVREWYHEAFPNIEETVKWGIPNFEHRGIVGNMAVFKNYVGLGFWKGALMKDPKKLFSGDTTGQMSALKIPTEKDLPAKKVFVAYIEEAIELNEKDVKPKKSAPKKAPPAPKIFTDALKKNKAASKHWQEFTPGKKKEYVEWITGAKTEKTRDKRLAQAVEWIAEGKPRNWKYMNC